MSKVFDLVLGVFREPGLLAELREKQLPDDLGQVIRLAAGEDAALQGAVDATGEAPETLLEASVFFLQQVLFAPGADSYRVLGASADWAQDRLRENYRWLMKWLHPDRNQDGWEAVYADRVNVAWQDLKTPDRRADYDRRVPSAAASLPTVGTALVRRPVAPPGRVASGPLLSGSAVRRLPALVLGSLGVLAALTIGLMYWAQSETHRELSERRRDRGDLPVDAPVAAAPAGDVAPVPVPAPAAVGSDAVPARPAEPDIAAATDARIAPLAAAIVSVDGAPPTAAASSPVPDLPDPVAPPMVVPEAVGPESPPVADAALLAAGGPDAMPVIPTPTPTPTATAIAADTARADLAPADAAPVATAVAVPKPSLPEPTLAAAPAPANPSVASGATSPPRPSPAAPAQPTPETQLKRPSTSAVDSEIVAASRPPERVRPPTASSAESPPPVPAPAAIERIATTPPTATAPAVVVASKPAGRDAQPRVASVAVDPAATAPSTAKPPVAAASAGDARRVVASTSTPATASAAAPTVTAEQSAARVEAPVRSDAEALVREFASAYAAGDLARFDRLLASGTRPAPAMDSMRSRFVSTEMRYLEIDQLRWHPEAGQGHVRAKFRDTYVPRGGRKAITESGDIEWTIRVDAGDVRIASMARSDAES